MAIRYLEDYRAPDICRKIANNIEGISKRPVCLMEVCGTHTVSIFRSGIRGLLPETISLVSGPGCPVCVTSLKEIDSFIAIAGMDNVILATFGDMMRVPGSGSSLKEEAAKGRDIRMVYSSTDALRIAEDNPYKKVVFAGIGFETTAPTVAASVISARNMNLGNFHVYSAHKLVPPALTALMENFGTRVNGFILPGHVSAIIGREGYRSFFDNYRVPSVISGFEPIDILQAIYLLIEQIEGGKAELLNGYQRIVTSEGNRKAQRIIEDVFEKGDAEWRGIGTIPESGLEIREDYKEFDAKKILDLHVPEPEEPAGCACGEIIMGLRTPCDCPLYKKACTPAHPVGPCMVSSEGTCAAYYKYHSA
ncbi:MAG TPA: hydrogenase formation protein HypD [Desulfatiglandales bacterium]|nr:hydrogenase formation protein HypD [Desulfatiglandales bacterium]